MCVEHIPHSDFLGEVWVNERGLAGAASANPSSFMVPGALLQTGGNQAEAELPQNRSKTEDTSG
jgi:hypothetical protein